LLANDSAFFPDADVIGPKLFRSAADEIGGDPAREGVRHMDLCCAIRFDR